ncbi:24772_t:CDS:1, partial [Gigaspora rosea]
NWSGLILKRSFDTLAPTRSILLRCDCDAESSSIICKDINRTF